MVRKGASMERDDFLVRRPVARGLAGLDSQTLAPSALHSLSDTGRSAIFPNSARSPGSSLKEGLQAVVRGLLAKLPNSSRTRCVRGRGAFRSPFHRAKPLAPM